MTQTRPKKALITGAASGIGLAISQRFSELNFELVMVDLNEQVIDLAEDLKAHSVCADLSQPEACQQAAIKANELLGGVNILINNAGIQHVAGIEDFAIEIWHKMIGLMLTAPFLLTQQVWPVMKRQHWGRIINLSSVHGLLASPNKSGYIAAKHGLMGLTKAVALEGADLGITANTLCPGFVRTPLMQNQLQVQAEINGLSVDQVIDQILLQRPAIKQLIEPEEVAEWVVFLCSDAAAKMTGSAINLDGGWSAS